jgi:hypothetical protein
MPEKDEVIDESLLSLHDNEVKNMKKYLEKEEKEVD